MEIIAAIDWSKWITTETVSSVARVLILVVVGFPVLFLLAAMGAKAAKKRLSPQGTMLIRKKLIQDALVKDHITSTISYQMSLLQTFILGMRYGSTIFIRESI